MTSVRLRDRRARRVLDPDQLSWTWQSASLLLDYPDDRLRERLGIVRRAATGLPAYVCEPLMDTVTRLSDARLEGLREDYVDTFDRRRRHNLFLTYFAYGDTRKRGMALLRFTRAYLDAGLSLDELDGELPDHLCVVLEYAATVDRLGGRQLLMDHRPGLELLRLALVGEESPWAGAVTAVTSTLPPLDGDEREAIQRLAAEGPPEEEVGLSAYGAPAFDPGPSAPVALPMPSFPGGDA